MHAGTEIAFFFLLFHQFFFVKSHGVAGEGWDGQDQGPSGHQAFLHSSLAETLS